MKTHIKNIGIENFRVFQDKTDFRFAPITILTGTNSSGKSSLMRAFYLMSHCFKTGNIEEVLDIEDVMNILGDFSKLPNRTNIQSGNKTVSFFIPIVLRGVIDKTQMKISYKLVDNCLGKLVGLSIISDKNEKEIFSINERDVTEEEKIFNNTSYSLDVKIDFSYFLNEYKRESEQIKEFKEKKELDNEPNILSKIHPQYFQYQKNIENKKGTITDDYKPFFNKYPGFFNEERYEIYDLTYTYAKKGKDAEFYGSQTNILKINPFNIDDDKDIRNNIILDNSKLIENSLLRNYEIIISKLKDKNSLSTKSSIYTIEYILRNLDYFIGASFESFGVPLRIPGENAVLVMSIQNIDSEVKEIIRNNSDSFIIEPNDFFFECFVDDNIRYSIKEALEQFKQCYFLGNYRNQIQRIYNSNDSSNFQALIKKIALAEKDEKNHYILKYIKKYLTRFEIGHDYEIVNSGEGQGYFLYILVKGERILLADLGYGISQVLPLIFKIISVALEDGDNKKLFIEEPESNLHPALQSKLAELFADAAEHFGIQFVIETHSEYFIRKLQMLTANTYAKNKDNRLPVLKTTDTQLYYFYPQDAVPEGEEQVYKINIEADGALTKNFGKGFFDESSNLNIALYNFTTANKN